MKPIDIAFSVNGSVTQTIEILDPTVSEQELLEKLKSGEFCTSIGHGDNLGGVYSVFPDYRHIGKVIRQEAQDDMEIQYQPEEEI